MSDVATMSPIEWERRVERRAACLMNLADAAYLRGDVSQVAYLAEIDRLEAWADAEIAGGPHQ